MRTLSVDDVILIHKRVVESALSHSDKVAVFRSGGQHAYVKDVALLESAVGRQISGIGDALFYPGPLENAATLMYGIAMNHAFHDGNKRAAIVCLLNHLDRNLYSIRGVKWKELEDLVLELVRGELHHRPKLRHVAHAARASQSDRSIFSLAEWVRQHATRLERGERTNITFKELIDLLKSHGFEVRDPSGNYIQIYKTTVREKRGLFGKISTTRESIHIGAMGYPGMSRTVAISELKKVRRICRLTEEDGVDSAAFYDENKRVDEIINENRRLLSSLANK